MHNNRFHIEEESLIIENSGEIPEVAFHSSVKYLTRDKDGPMLKISPEEMQQLKEAVIRGYMRIIQRDLDPDNRDKGIYRGLARCIVNWKRMKKFCHYHEHDISSLTLKISRKLLSFLETEINDIQNHNQNSCINCRENELLEFARDLGLSKEDVMIYLEKIY